MIDAKGLNRMQLDQHDDWCETEFHDVPPAEAAADEPEPCRGPVEAQVGPVAAYLRASAVGPMVALLGIDGAALPAQRAADWAEKLLQLAVKGGATRPAPGAA